MLMVVEEGEGERRGGGGALFCLINLVVINNGWICGRKKIVTWKGKAVS